MLNLSLERIFTFSIISEHTVGACNWTFSLWAKRQYVDGVSLSWRHHGRRGRETHICVNELGYQWFRLKLGAYRAPNYCLDQWCCIVSWTIRNENFSEILIKVTYFLWRICIKNVVCQMTAILSRPKCVKRTLKQLKPDSCMRTLVPEAVILGRYK